MRRREFITAFGGAATWPLVALAQQAARTRRIGILLYSQEEKRAIIPMLQGLEALGYIEGKNIAVEYRDAEGKAERLPQMADELVHLSPDVIFARGGELAPVVKKATSTIPIVVMVNMSPNGTTQKLPTPPGYVGYQRTNRTFRGEGPESALLTPTGRKRVAFAAVQGPDLLYSVCDP